MIKFLDIEDNRNVFVVGDIHGCYTDLINKLKEIGFNFNSDLLVAVGDLIDRGDENIKCFNLLKEHWFTTIKGNHEDFCVQGNSNYNVEFYHKMKNNGGEWFYQLDEDERNIIANRFKQLPVLIELKYKGKKYGFVHADVPVEDWELLKEMVENNDNQIDSERSVIDACLWSRRIVEMDHVEIAQIDRVFLGHTVLPEIKHIGNCTFLDTGGVFKEHDKKYRLSIIKL